MLEHETVNKLRYMKLTGIAEALKEQNDDDTYQEMGYNGPRKSDKKSGGG